MAKSVLVDAGFLVALVSRRDRHHPWAVRQEERHPTPWRTCEAVLSEAYHLLGARGVPVLGELLSRQAVALAFDLEDQLEPMLKLLRKYADVPASLADASLGRMTEILPDPLLLTTDTNVRVYRRHSRQAVPHEAP